MNENSMAKSKKGLFLKAVISVLVLSAIFGIWVIKNYKKDVDSAGAGKAAEIVSGNIDFELHVTEKIDLQKLKSYGLPIIIDFGADSCIPCKEMAPVLKELNSELKGKAIIKFVDVWKYQELVQGYPVNLIPTQILFSADGKPYKPEDTKTGQMKLYSLKDSGEHVFTVHEGGMTKDQMLAVLKEMGLK